MKVFCSTIRFFHTICLSKNFLNISLYFCARYHNFSSASCTAYFKVHSYPQHIKINLSAGMRFFQSQLVSNLHIHDSIQTISDFGFSTGNRAFVNPHLSFPIHSQYSSVAIFLFFAESIFIYRIIIPSKTAKRQIFSPVFSLFSSA